MSFNNSLRRGLAGAQDSKALDLGLPFTGDVLQVIRGLDREGPRPSDYKSKADRRRLAVAALTSDLHRHEDASLRVGTGAWYWVGVVGPEESFGFTRSSEAGIRQREAAAQVQCSRTFSQDLLSEQDLREDAYYDGGDGGSYGDDLAYEVAQQERDFGPEQEVEADEEEEEAFLQARRKALGFCPDCGEPGERRGHQECQYPSND